MSNYRVRQVLTLGPMPERQLRLLVALATWMTDETRTVRIGFDTVIKATGRTHNTIRLARRELSETGRLDYQAGRYCGDLTLWTVLCLPEKGTSEFGPLNGEPKGTSEFGPLNGEPKGTSEFGPLTAVDEPRKGTNSGPVRVPNEAAEGYQPESADLHESDRKLNLLAKPSSSLGAPNSKSSAASSSIENILGDPGLGSPQRSRKTADLNGDQPIPVDVSAVDTDTERVAAYELAVLADRAGDTTPVPDGYAARVAAVILATAGRTVHMPVLYVRKVIKAEPARYWPPNGTQ